MARCSPYRVQCGIALLRASTDPGGLDVPGDLSAPDAAPAGQHAGWLATLWAREEVRAAVAVASPSLYEQVTDLVRAGENGSRDASRAVLAMTGYLLRWQSRATPFGLFAGVGAARVGGAPEVRWRPGSAVVRADTDWVAGIVARLEACPELLEHLLVTGSGTGTARGDRLVFPGPVPDGTGEELAPAEVSVRGSRPVRAALETAREPVPFGKLAAQLSADLAAGERQVRDMLTALVAQGILVSSLRPPMTCTDALGYLSARLSEVADGHASVIGDLADSLAAVHRDLRSDITPLTDRRVRALSQRMTNLARSDMPLAVDTVLDCDVRVPEQVAREAADAAGVLCRLSPCPGGHRAWAGSGALMPVLDLVADSGLGFPAGFLGSARELPPRAVARRDVTLLAMVQRAMAAGQDEIALTDDVIESLAPGDAGQPVQVAARAEIAVEVRAVSLDALRSGRFTLLVTGTPRPASSMIGRHLHLLDPADRDLLAESYTACDPGAVPAQLSFAPRKRRNENVARTARYLPVVIPVGEHLGDADSLIHVADLAVTADDTGFRLLALSTGQQVEPRVTHALEASLHTPPLARFLAEVATARCAVYTGFDFGAASRLPYLPRVRYRRTVLSAARWLLSAADLPARKVGTAEWEKAFAVWRECWKVPRHVALFSQGRRQPVDLTRPACLSLLRARLHHASEIELRECTAPDDLGWIGRAHELVIPLTAAAAATERALARAVPVPRAAAVTQADGRLLRMELHGHPARFDEILTRYVPPLDRAFGESVPVWWTRTSGEPGRDARITLTAGMPGPQPDGALIAELAAWADRLRGAGLLAGATIATGDSQPGRFGSGPALRAAHLALAADSRAAIAEIEFCQASGLCREAVAAASMTGIAVRFAASPAEAMQWLAADLPKTSERLDPAARNAALSLAGLAGKPRAGARSPGEVMLSETWTQRADAIGSYLQALPGGFSRREAARGLVLEHAARTGAGSSACGLARACALRYLAAKVRM
jgi:thiopeptide-type bacteriocin biosynthesis protein